MGTLIAIIQFIIEQENKDLKSGLSQPENPSKKNKLGIRAGSRAGLRCLYLN